MYVKRAFKSSLIVFLFVVVSTIIGYALRIYLSHVLPIETFGLFYAVTAFVVLFTAFVISNFSVTCWSSKAV